MILIRKRIFAAASALFLLAGTAVRLTAQGTRERSGSIDLAVTFAGQRSLQVNTGQNFWTEGGSIELGADAYKGFGLAADVNGSHTASMGSGGVPLSLVTETFGPRYRWHDGRRTSLYGEGLVGEAHGFHSLFPSLTGALPEATSLAVLVGGGVDLRLGHHLAARVLEAAWLHTQLPNSTNNMQNNFRLGAGIVLRIGSERRIPGYSQIRGGGGSAP